MNKLEVQNIVLPSAYDFKKKIKNRLEKFAKKINDSKIMQWFGYASVENLFYIYLLNKYKSNCLIKHKGRGNNHLGITLYIENKTLYEYENIMLDDVVNQLSKCIKRGIESIIIPLTLQDENSLHANVLIYRKNNNSIEHFEPHGGYIGNIKELFYNSNIEEKLNKFINKLNTKLKGERLTEVVFEPSYRVCPHEKGLQAIENEIEHTILENGESETGGYCLAWSMFFTELALQNPEFSSQQLLTMILKSSELKPDYIKNLIRGYVLNISEKLEKYFKIIFGQTTNLEYIYKAMNGNDDDEEIEMRKYINQIIDIELLLLNDDFDKEAYLRNIESQILSIEEKTTLTIGARVNLRLLNSQKKILENIHILEDANQSAKDSTLKYRSSRRGKSQDRSRSTQRRRRRSRSKILQRNNSY
jgi:hypothetical protein